MQQHKSEPSGLCVYTRMYSSATQSTAPPPPCTQARLDDLHAEAEGIMLIKMTNVPVLARMPAAWKADAVVTEHSTCLVSHVVLHVCVCVCVFTAEWEAFL